MKINLVKHEGKLLPAMDEDKEKLSKGFVEGEVVLIEVKKQRNYKFHKKYWSLLKLVFENLPENFLLGVGHGYGIPITDINELHYQVKMKAGLYDKKKTWGGNIALNVKSIAFDKMDEHEFSEFYDKVFDIITRHFLVGVDREDLEAEVAGYF